MLPVARAAPVVRATPIVEQGQRACADAAFRDGAQDRRGDVDAALTGPVTVAELLQRLRVAIQPQRLRLPAPDALPQVIAHDAQVGMVLAAPLRLRPAWPRVHFLARFAPDDGPLRPAPHDPASIDVPA